ncbi:MAG: hypothetical protein LBU61_01545 [Coriobacteriales bacterium]|nr:hypothetical protein [Coriobacteriales bacterium]
MDQADIQDQVDTGSKEQVSNHAMLAFSELCSDFAEKMQLVDQRQANCPQASMAYYLGTVGRKD